MYSLKNRFVIPSDVEAGLYQYLILRTRAFDDTADIPQHLFTAAVQDMNLAEPLPGKISLKHDSMKYRVVSCLQKAIRRGELDLALQCAAALHTHDDAYLWRRLGIIALEDLGLMGMELAVVLMTYGGQRQLRWKYDSLRLTLYMVEQMVLSVKDRSFCETCNTEPDPENAQFRERCFYLGKDQEAGNGFGLTEVFQGMMQEPEAYMLTARFLICKAMAGLLANGHGKSAERLKGDRDTYFEWVQNSDLPALVKLVTKLGVMRGCEGLSVAAPFAWRGFVQGTPSHVKVRTFDLDYSPRIAGLPSYSYDGHSIEGKAALAKFVKECEPVKQWLDDHKYEGDRNRFVKSAVFWAEGGMVWDRHLQSEYWDFIYGASYYGEARRYGFDLADLMAFYHLVRLNLAGLHAARRKVLT